MLTSRQILDVRVSVHYVLLPADGRTLYVFERRMDGEIWMLTLQRKG